MLSFLFFVVFSLLFYLFYICFAFIFNQRPKRKKKIKIAFFFSNDFQFIWNAFLFFSSLSFFVLRFPHSFWKECWGTEGFLKPKMANDWWILISFLERTNRGRRKGRGGDKARRKDERGSGEERGGGERGWGKKKKKFFCLKNKWSEVKWFVKVYFGNWHSNSYILIFCILIWHKKRKIKKTS